jgi:hypothetical protein
VGKKLVIHVGLPKTATTSLQTHFFPQVAGYLGKRYWSLQVESQVEEPTETYREFATIQDAYSEGEDWEGRLADWANRLDFSEQRVQVISTEGLARWASPQKLNLPVVPGGRACRGEFPRRGAHPVTVFLAKLRDSLPSDVSLFTIVTLRNQADFLGSLTAEVNRGVRGGGAVIDLVIQREDAYVDFYSLVTELEKVTGPSQHLTLLFEDGVEQNCKNIVEFAGLTPLKEGFNFELGKAQNVRATGDNTWQRNNYKPRYLKSGVFVGLRKVILGKFPRLSPAMREIHRFVLRTIVAVGGAFRQTVSISDGDRLKLQEHCAASNQRLAEHLKRDLAFLGY